ncbi:hypothetical protein FB567DRAFT_182142 [Paraphoma chrysanthemicola]|uniref:Uncharacterized protein n=1 Tax=Paraphoma chrysanthemicola TaxID=798071 RepID=A0A8K0QX12_9PLEO|nr:hypothetical protein FB567DRAFT_182142 [Paraphoma chrysanthemicola]
MSWQLYAEHECFVLMVNWRFFLRQIRSKYTMARRDTPNKAARPSIVPFAVSESAIVLALEAVEVPAIDTRTPVELVTEGVPVVCAESEAGRYITILFTLPINVDPRARACSRNAAHQYCEKFGLGAKATIVLCTQQSFIITTPLHLAGSQDQEIASRARVLANTVVLAQSAQKVSPLDPVASMTGPSHRDCHCKRSLCAINRQASIRCIHRSHSGRWMAMPSLPVRWTSAMASGY